MLCSTIEGNSAGARVKDAVNGHHICKVSHEMGMHWLPVPVGSQRHVCSSSPGA